MSDKCVQGMLGSGAERGDKGDTDGDEGADRRHFQQGKPELKFSIGSNGQKVGRRHQRHQTDPDSPDREGQADLMQQLRAGHGLRADGEDPEIPIEPAGHETRPRTQGQGGIFRKTAFARLGYSHFAQHAHDQKHQQSAGGIGEDDAGSTLVDRSAAADKHARTDDPAKGNHRDVPGLQGLRQGAGRGGSQCGAQVLLSSPVNAARRPVLPDRGPPRPEVANRATSGWLYRRQYSR